MEIKNVLVSEAYTNCYLVKNEENDEGFIIDPGGSALKISRCVEQMDMTPKAILLTHGHFDHIGAVDELRDRYDIKVYVSEEESKFMQNYNNNLSVFFGEGMIVKPIISSPGTGVQHLENLTATSPIPSTTTPLLELLIKP